MPYLKTYRSLFLLLFLLLLIFAVQGQNSPQLESTLSDRLLVDRDGDGRLDAGDTLRYTLEITNCGSVAAENVQFTGQQDPNTQFLANSVQVGAPQVAATCPPQVSNPNPNNPAVTPPSAAPIVQSSSPANGDTEVAINANITLQFNKAVDVTGNWFEIVCTSGTFNINSGNVTVTGGPINFTFDPNVDLQVGETCTVTVFAANVNDQDSNDPPDNMAADYVFSFTTETPPTVVSTSPTNGATAVLNSSVIVVTFDEPVTITTASFTLECPAGSFFAGGFSVSGSGTAVVTITPTGNLPASTNCRVVIIAANVTDSSGNQLDGDGDNVAGDDYTFSFTIDADAAPTVTSVTPANGAVSVPTNTTITITFSELVYIATAADFSIACPAGGPLQGLTVTTPATLPDWTTTVVIDPAGLLPDAIACEVTVNSDIEDFDSDDPPDTMAAPFVWTFTTEAPPSITTTNPANGATGIPTSSNIVINFDEPVDVTSSSFTIECPVGTNIPYTPSGSGTNSITLDPTAPLPATTTCTVTVSDADVSDSDLIDPPNDMLADYIFSFDTLVDLAPTVDQPNIAPASTSTGANSASLDNPVSTTPTITIPFSEAVDAASGAFTLICNAAPVGITITPPLTASGQNSFDIVPTGAIAEGANCVLTVVAANINDSDSDDLPDDMLTNFTLSFSVDIAPAETLTETEVGGIFIDITGAGATNVDLDSDIQISFNEAVNITFPANALQCPAGNNIPVTVTGNGTATITLNPNTNLPLNTTCVLNIPAANISDSDTADAPDNPLLAVNHSFTTANDNAPTVSTNPADTGSNIAVNSNITVTFNDPVTLTGAWFDLDCSVSGQRTSSGELTGTGIFIIENTPNLVYTIDPIDDFGAGDVCTITIDSANVVDNDIIDPPNELDGDASGDIVDGDGDDYQAIFSTQDMPPQVDTAASSPVDGAIVPNDQNVTLNFTELVDIQAAAISFVCDASAVAFMPTLPQLNVSSITLNPNADLADGADCTVTLDSNLIQDDDTTDAPDDLDGSGDNDIVDGDADDFVLNFTVDAAPIVTSATVEVAGLPTTAAGATNVDLDSNIVINFNEAIDASATAVTLECPAGNPVAFAGLPITNNTSITINPSADLPGNTACVLTILAAQIVDTDSFDLPNELAADLVYNFTTQSLAVDDVYTITPHLTYSSATAGLNLLDNDQPSTATITGFGTDLASANGTAPNGSNSITAGGAGGRVVMNADGTFLFYPDAGDDNSDGTVTFFYTITGGDTAQVTLTFEAEEFVWFVDNSASGTEVCTGTNVGTQACPSADLATVVAVDTAGDTIFVASGSYTCGIILEVNERLIGDGSSSNLQALSGVSPVAGSDFSPYASFSGADPVLTSSATDCITLATGNTIRGVTIGNTGNFAGIVGTNYGTLSILETTINGDGQILNLDSGTVNASFDSLSSSSSDNSFAALRVASSTANFTSIGGTTVNGSATGVEAILLISNAGTGFNLGVTSVNKTTAGRGVVLGNGIVQTSPVVFTSLAITTSAGTALETNRQTGLVIVSNPTGSISATGGAAVNIINAVGNTTPLSLSLGALSASNSSLATTCLAGTSPAAFCATGATGLVSVLNLTVTTGINRYGIRINNSTANFTFSLVFISGMAALTAETDFNVDGYPDTTTSDGDGVFLSSNTGSFTINGGLIQNTNGSGADNVDIRSSTNIVFNNTVLSSAGKSNFQAINMTGTGSFNNGSVSGAAASGANADAFYFRANTGTLNLFDIDNTNCTMSSAANAEDCVEYTAEGTHTGTLDIDGDGLGPVGNFQSNQRVVEAYAFDIATLTLNMNNIQATPVGTGIGGMTLASADGATLIFRVQDNRFTNMGNGLAAVDGVIRIIPQDTASTLRGRFENNIVDIATGYSLQSLQVIPLNTMSNFELYINYNSLEASGTQPAILFRTDAIVVDDPALSNAHVFMQNNIITSQGTTIDARGIDIHIRDQAGGSNLRFDIRNNDINMTAGTLANAIRIRMQPNAINTHATVANNFLNSGASVEFVADVSHSTNNFCLTLTGHTAGEFNLSRSAGTFNFFNGGNIGATVNQSGTINAVGGACTLPSSSGLVYEYDSDETVASIPTTQDRENLILPVLAEAFSFGANTTYAQSNNLNIPLGPINIGTIPANSSVTVTFDVAVNAVIPNGTSSVSLQGIISGSNFASILTDDPETSLDTDLTLTPLDALQAVQELPQTGEEAWWQSPLIWTLRLVLLSILIVGLITIRRRFFRAI